MHDALWDPFVIEVEDLLAEVEILEGCGATVADPQGVLIVRDRSALPRRQGFPSIASNLVGVASLATFDSYLAVLDPLPHLVARVCHPNLPLVAGASELVLSRPGTSPYPTARRRTRRSALPTGAAIANVQWSDMHDVGATGSDGSGTGGTCGSPT